MVLPTEKYNFLDASCCKVDVVNGAAGDFFAGFLSSFPTEKSAPIFCFKKASAFSLDAKVLFNLASKTFPFSVLKLAFILYDASGVKPSISRSLSTINLTATDCTRPAERPGLIFFHSTGDN